MSASAQMECRAGVPGSAGAGSSQPAPVSLVLPAPPSTNGLFLNLKGKGRVITPEYRNWRMLAATSIRLQKVRKVTGRVIILIGVERHSDQADIDNRIKAIQDALVKANVIDDDKFVTAAFAVWSPKANHLAHVAIYPCQRMTLTFHPSHDGASGALVVNAPSPEEDETDDLSCIA